TRTGYASTYTNGRWERTASSSSLESQVLSDAVSISLTVRHLLRSAPEPHRTHDRTVSVETAGFGDRARECSGERAEVLGARRVDPPREHHRPERPGPAEPTGRHSLTPAPPDHDRTPQHHRLA